MDQKFIKAVQTIKYKGVMAHIFNPNLEEESGISLCVPASST